MATSTVPITPGSGQQVAIDSNSVLAAGAAVQIMALANSDGSRPPNDPDGTIQVSAEATTLFTDDLQSLTLWTTAGTAPTVAAGQVTFASSTTASAASSMRTIDTFPLRIGSYTRPIFHVRHDAAAVANTGRWWGIGTPQSTPTADLPLLNGVVFELRRSDGALYAVTYSAGVRTEVAQLTRQTDGALHRYEIWYRQSRVFWSVDGNTTPGSGLFASVAFANLAVANTLPLTAGQVNHTTGPSAAPTLVLSAAGVADHSGTVHTIGDATVPTRQATVKPASTAATSTDTALVTAFHPSSPLPAGTNTLGGVTLPTGTDYTVTSTASTNAGVVKASAGSIAELQVWNPTTSAAWVKLFRKASAPTVGTDTPFYVLPVAAGSSSAPLLVERQFPPIGKRFSTGIAIAITGAAADTDTTATVAGIRVTATVI